MTASQLATYGVILALATLFAGVYVRRRSEPVYTVVVSVLCGALVATFITYPYFEKDASAVLAYHFLTFLSLGWLSAPVFHFFFLKEKSGS